MQNMYIFVLLCTSTSTSSTTLHTTSPTSSTPRHQIMLDTMRVTQRACIGGVALFNTSNCHFTPTPCTSCRCE
jgi:hypothetical protein